MTDRQSVFSYGLIGHPVAHSLSPVMHAAAFKSNNINACYRLFDIPSQKLLEEFLLNPEKKISDTEGNVLRSGDIQGFNITVPHKVSALKILQSAANLKITIDNSYALVAGAINTVKRSDRGLECCNTDVWGFRKSLEIDLKFDWQNSRVVLIGCGGAARAIVTALTLQLDSAEKIFIYDIDKDAIQSAREHFSQFDWVNKIIEFIDSDKLQTVIKNSQLLVNSTPLGMKPGDPSPVAKDFLHKDLYVYDAVYNRSTQLTNDALDKGCKAAGGKGMLAYQAAQAWGLWFNKPEPCDIMVEALEKELR